MFLRCDLEHHTFWYGVFVLPPFIEILFLAPMISLSQRLVCAGVGLVAECVCVRLFLSNRPV